MYNKLENKQNNISYELLSITFFRVIYEHTKNRYQLLFSINDLKTVSFD